MIILMANPFARLTSDQCLPCHRVGSSNGCLERLCTLIFRSWRPCNATHCMTFSANSRFPTSTRPRPRTRAPSLRMHALNVLDVLRGLSLFGILQANVLVFSCSQALPVERIKLVSLMRSS